MRSKLLLGWVAVGVAGVGFGLWPVLNGTQTFSERLLDGSAAIWDAADRMWDQVTEGALAPSWRETGEAWWAWLSAPASSDPSRAEPARSRSSGRSSAASSPPAAPEPAQGDATEARAERLHQAQRRLGGDPVPPARLDVPAGAQDRAGLDQRLRNVDTPRP